MSKQQQSQQGMVLASQRQAPEHCADIPWVSVASICEAIETTSTTKTRLEFFKRFKSNYIKPSAKDQLQIYRILCTDVSSPACSMHPCEAPCLASPPCMHARTHHGTLHPVQLDLKRTYYMKEQLLAKRLCDAFDLSHNAPTYKEVTVSCSPPACPRPFPAFLLSSLSPARMRPGPPCRSGRHQATNTAAISSAWSWTR